MSALAELVDRDVDFVTIPRDSNEAYDERFDAHILAADAVGVLLRRYDWHRYDKIEGSMWINDEGEHVWEFKPPYRTLGTTCFFPWGRIYRIDLASEGGAS